MTKNEIESVVNDCYMKKLKSFVENDLSDRLSSYASDPDNLSPADIASFTLYSSAEIQIKSLSEILSTLLATPS